MMSSDTVVIPGVFSHGGTSVTRIYDEQINLHVELHKGWLEGSDATKWYNTIVENVRWYRVKYHSGRFGNECETPCWTTFYGGFDFFSPYEPVPAWLQPLVARVSACLGGVPFNAMLLRLYFDGSDEIAWHTDGREFLGETPTIASLSLGSTAGLFFCRFILDLLVRHLQSLLQLQVLSFDGILPQTFRCDA